MFSYNSESVLCFVISNIFNNFSSVCLKFKMQIFIGIFYFPI